MKRTPIVVGLIQPFWDELSAWVKPYIFFLTLAIMFLSCSPRHDRSINVFAASSTLEVMTELAEIYERKTETRVRLNFASSSVLARQIEAGARVDVFVSAHPDWMEYLEVRQAVLEGSRIVLMRNRLVLAAHPETAELLSASPRKAWPELYTGRLALGDPEHVPAGIYAREALKKMGWWSLFQDRLAPAADVRAALRLLERGEVGLGVVYTTDLGIADVNVLLRFPPMKSIQYTAAACRPGKESSDFLRFLNSDEADAVKSAHGFIVER